MRGKSYSGLHINLLVTLLLLFLAAIAEGATVSGTVTNPTSKSGLVYVALTDQNGNRNLGVSKTIAASGGTASYTINGVPDGSYTLDAFLDSRYGGKDSSIRHANDLHALAGSINVNGSNQSNLNMTLAAPTPVQLSAQLSDFANSIQVANDGTGTLLTIKITWPCSTG